MIRAALCALWLLWAASPAFSGTQPAPDVEEGLKVAVFAGGCFWCMEKPFDEVPGVISTTSGYTGGTKASPTYQEVVAKRTGHYEAMRVVYDPEKVGYAQLLDVFWRNIAPTQADGQFCDRGAPYRTAIFTSDPEERRLAEATKAAVAKRLAAEVATQILPASTFWVAEAYHQDFYLNNPVRYQQYRTSCGRDRTLREIWGEPGAR